MSYYGNILEEELKNKVAADLFPGFDTTQIIGRIDFCVSIPADPLGINEAEPLLWAEAKKGTSHDIYESFIQLILTIGKERPQDNILPPAFIGAFDAEKIAFLPYNKILDVLHQNDFNWNVTPSDHSSKEFQQLLGLLKNDLQQALEIYHYDRDAKELSHFIRHNFNLAKAGVRHIRINKNNFTHIYLKWLEEVKPTININWEVAKKAGIIDADFYLADILSKENHTLGEKLFVLLKDDHYLLDRQINDLGLESYSKAQFNDDQRAHTQFWNRYARPPRREYWDYIVNRRDLLVPQDVRERKGSFFTPSRWVELSQQYIAAELGENWQEEYYVWDCCAGTGNLLAGLTNKYNIYASTLDKADVQAMLQRIGAMNAAARDKEKGGANLLDSHVFQFDFLNDPFFDETDSKGNVTKKSKLPKSLQEIIADLEKRKKLVIYINPPYAEAANKKTVTGGGENKKDVAVKHYTYRKYLDKIGIAGRELFAQFFMRIYDEIPSSVLAEFSTLKILQAPNFREFRQNFRAKLGKNFIVPADTFDNVTGQFPIGFFIWHLQEKEIFINTIADVYDAKGNFLCTKQIEAYDKSMSINNWIISSRNRPNKKEIGFMSAYGNDFQHTNYNYIINTKNQLPQPRGSWITDMNIEEVVVYCAVRHCIEPTWLNDRDQFLHPNNGWKNNRQFVNDCFVYSLFGNFNNIQVEFGTNHWIPFTEEEVCAQEKFESHFMSDYIKGKQRPVPKQPQQGDLFAEVQPECEPKEPDNAPLQFSKEAQDVMDAGRELWRYYHQQPIAKEQPNASFYDIRRYFQGTRVTASGREMMNTESDDATYTALLSDLRQKMKVLAKRIEPKVYEYGFLK
ncbi:MAG: hypothetical protein IJS43_06405 [Bacteroidaceae bacterium]|nr:hypothetical protein [Bacteroidaceae bacterium]